MNELSPEAQAALARARRAHDPDPASFARVQRAFLAAKAGLDVAGTGADGAPPVAAPASAAGGGATLSSAGATLAKLLGGGKVGLAVVTLAGGAYLAAGPSASVPPASVPPAMSAAAPGPAAAQAQEDGPVREPLRAEGLTPPAVPAAPLSSSVPSAARSRAPQRAVSQARTTPPPAVPAAQPTAEPSAQGAQPTSGPEPSRADIPAVRAGIDAAELALLRSAVDQVSRGAHREALRTLDEHAARYPQTPLALERRGVRAIALCASGERASGRHERAAFLEEGSRSPLAARVRAACAEEAP